jgi:hypothetical protein
MVGGQQDKQSHDSALATARRGMARIDLDSSVSTNDAAALARRPAQDAKLGAFLRSRGLSLKDIGTAVDLGRKGRRQLAMATDDFHRRNPGAAKIGCI